MLSTAVSNVEIVDSLFYNLSTNYFTVISDGIILVDFVYQYFIWPEYSIVKFEYVKYAPSVS